jgi:hypothetical protein
MASQVRNEAAPVAKTKLHSRSVAAAECIVPLRDARGNCLNLKGVIAIKLVAAPRYQFVGSITYKNRLERTPGLTLPYFSETPQSRFACSRARMGARP